MFRSLRKFLGGLFGLLIFLVLLAVIGRIFLFEIVRTDSYSMVPTLVAGDVFLVLTKGKLGPGNVAVCRNPDNPKSMVVGRIVGIPGTTISIRRNVVSINNRKVDHQFTGQRLYVDTTSGESLNYLVALADEYIGGYNFSVALMERAGDSNFAEYEVEDGFFLLGDNRNMARDSRHFGEVPIEDCIGMALVLIWPGEDSGDFKRKKRFLEWLI